MPHGTNRTQGLSVGDYWPLVASPRASIQDKTYCAMRLLKFLAILMFTFSGLLHAAFQDAGWGARPVGMGGAFAAIADDSNASLFNPAGLTQVQSHEFSAMYARLFSGLTLYSGDDTVRLGQSYLAYASKPTKFGSLGLSWANFTTTHLYREDSVALSWAKPVMDGLSVGTNVKYLRRSLALDARTVNDPVFSGGNDASAISLDAGVLYKLQENVFEGLRVGLAAKNINQPNVGFKEKDTVPLEWRLGLAYQANQMPWLVPAFDVTRRRGETGYHGGLESWLFGNTLGLRAGGNKNEASAGLSYFQSVNKKFGFRLDYGFTIPFQVEDTNGSHRFQATLYF